MRISDWSSDVCSSDLHHRLQRLAIAGGTQRRRIHVDTLLDDHAVFHDKLVDAAPGKLPPRDEPRALPFDDADIAAPAPVEQLPDEIRRGSPLRPVPPRHVAAGPPPLQDRPVPATILVP